MAQPACSLQHPLGHRLSLHCSQVDAGKVLRFDSRVGDQTSGLVALRRRCRWGPQRSRLVKVLAMGRKKEVGKGGENERPELKLDTADLMELEFGKLLGEPRQATLAKVVGRKLNPEVSYVEIERKTAKKIQSSPPELSEAEFSRLLNQEGRVPIRGVRKPAVESTEDLPGLAKPPPRPGRPSFSEAEFSRLLNQEARPSVRGRASETSEDFVGLAKPPRRPGQPLPQVLRSASSDNAAKSSSAAQRKKAVPLVTFGPGGFAAQTKKSSAEEDDYRSLVQKPAIPSPDSIKPSWPKNDSVPPMLLGKSTKDLKDADYMNLVQKPAVRPVVPESSGAVVNGLESNFKEAPKAPPLMNKPSLAKPSTKAVVSSGPPVVDIPSSDISEQRFRKLLQTAGPTEEDECVPSETSTTSASISVEKPTKRKESPKLGSKPVLAAKPPPKIIESRDSAREADLPSVSPMSTDDVPSISLDSAAVDFEITRPEVKAEPVVSPSDLELKAANEKSTIVAKSDKANLDGKDSIPKLVKKASLVAPVRPPKRIDKAASDSVAGKTGDAEDIRLGRLAGEAKAADKQSENALPDSGARGPSEIKVDELDQRKRAEIRQRPLLRPAPPPVTSIADNSPESNGNTVQKRILSRPAIPNPKPSQPFGASTQDLAAGSSQQSATSYPERRIPSKEEEDKDWARAEALRESRAVEKVVFAKALPNGMLVNFGSLQGSVVAYELSSRRRPPPFATWAQDNGHALNRKLKSSVAPENKPKIDSDDSMEPRIKSDDVDYKNLLKQYEEARANLLTALVGETAKVVVVAVDRERKQLRFSEKEAEGEGRELAQKKAQLMTSLNVGDVVKCTVKKVTNFGAFVEVQGVPALIHISELSWNRVTDPSTILNHGDEIEVKVCRLDRYLQRINLSLKQMQPDPLRETLESLVSSDLREPSTSAKASNADETTGIPELVGVTKRLEEYKGIDSVQLGRRIQGTALAPTFQVYLSVQLDDGFKLLARSGNQVQEVLVQTSLDRDSMKDAIRACTFSDD